MTRESLQGLRLGEDGFEEISFRWKLDGGEIGVGRRTFSLSLSLSLCVSLFDSLSVRS